MITIKKRIALESFINREYPPLRQGFDSSTNVDEKGCPIKPFDVNVEDYISDNPNYGKIDKSFIYFPIFIQQKYDDMGLYTDLDYIESDVLINEALDSYIRKTGLPVQNYYTIEDTLVTGLTESNLDVVRSYNENNPYIINFNLFPLPSQGFTGVIEIKEDSIVYVVNGDVDNVGKYIPETGVILETFTFTRTLKDPITGELKNIPLTTFRYYTKGFRDYNTSLSAIVHEEKYLGVIETPRVDNDVLIDRGTVNVNERHLKMSEIDSVEQLKKYGQGFFNVTTV